ncbi:YycH family regulatory protein [Paenibacillus hodogayensis]|uniref:YycH family regulatory protein n=1 Tax=Paenibacillus hodogayensis TaxID=279208 RepID=A0ABV5W0E5_9BACL
MIEKFKTAALAFLVLASLLQSYLLLFSSPRQLPTNKTEYVQADPIGTQISAEELIFPEQIVLHTGKQTHMALYPNHAHFKEIMKMLKGRTFDNFRKSGPMQTGLDWEEIRSKQAGVEVRFSRGGVPFSILKGVFQLRGDLPLDTEGVNRIWIYVNRDAEEVRTFFLTDYNTYEARADLNNKNVEQMVGFGELLVTYHMKDDFYLPDTPLEVAKYKIATSTMPIDQLQKTLFVDPLNTRNFRNKDDSDIYYTDGKRGLQVKTAQLWMSYTDPVPAVDSRNDVKENLNSAVQFINQHGGWNGTFMARSLTQSQLIGRQQYTFRQYYDSFPIIGDRSETFGLIRVVLQNRVVANYDRSIMMLDTGKVERSLKTLPGGKVLDDMLNAYSRKNQIVAVMPAYQPIAREGEMELNPVWAVELRDGTYDVLK